MEGPHDLSTIDLEPIDRVLVRPTIAPQRSRFAEAAERTAGFLLLAWAGPIIATSAVALAGLSRRSPFVAHLRVGKGGKPMWVWKLRTMWSRDEPRPAPMHWVEYVVADPAEGGKLSCDLRISSRLARFCRRHSIDELPQLWHVLRGEMSLVGPRPLTRGEIDRYYGHNAAELLSVKPGLTGLWQVYGRSAIRFPRRSALDLELVRTLKPRLYVSVLLRTIPAVIRGNGAW